MSEHPLLAQQPSRLCFAGDWHGNTNFAGGRIMSAAARGADVLLHVGDFGFWHGYEGKAYIDSLERVCAREGLPILWIDGNHEDHDLLAELPQENGLGKVSDHVWHIPRGTRWEWGGLRFGGLGGATSVDRQLRSPGKDWWPQEELTPVDLSRWITGGPVDVVLTHDAPAGVRIPGIDRMSGVGYWGAHAIDTAEKHRIMLADALETTRPAVVVHGHFHVRYETVWRYPGGKATVVGLDCDGYPPPRNTWLVELGELREIVDRMRATP